LLTIALTILFTWDRSSVLPSTYIVAATSAAASTPTGVPAGRVTRLARGVNMTEWFWAPTGLTRRFASSDFALIRQLGFTYVRLPIGLNTIFAESSADLLNHSKLADIDEAIQHFLSHGLAISLDIHSIAGLEENPQFIDRFVQFWASFAAHLSTADPEIVFIEPLNEPTFSGRYDAWYTRSRHA
jgi:aryl-phospho-beta-D-glucosidase BglC (GH1 family)